MADYIIHVLYKSVKNNSHDISGIGGTTQLPLPISGEFINITRTPSPWPKYMILVVLRKIV